MTEGYYGGYYRVHVPEDGNYGGSTYNSGEVHVDAVVVGGGDGYYYDQSAYGVLEQDVMHTTIHEG